MSGACPVVAVLRVYELRAVEVAIKQGLASVVAVGGVWSWRWGVGGGPGQGRDHRPGGSAL